MRLCPKFPYLSAHVSVGYETFRVELHVVKRQPVNVGTAFEQRQQPHIEAQRTHCSQSVALFYDRYLMHSQVERKSQAHMPYRNLHAGGGGEASGYLFYYEILYGGDVN